MTLSNQDLVLLSTLLDEAIDLTEAEQAEWLRRLAEPRAHLRETLRELLTQRANIETHEFLTTLPPVVASAAHGAGVSMGLHAGATIGPYELIRALGSGGMGAVWLATRSDASIRRPVALKLPYAALQSEVLAERFTRERDILAGLAHVHIARLYDAGITASGQPYLALEYVDGIPMTQFCDAQRLSIRQRLALFQQVLAAVQYAHAHLVIHRDLKPSNVLVTAEGQVMLLDFGIAKLIVGGEAKETALTLHGGRVLTPDYAAPEQIAGAPITTATDVYALGVMLYELMTGERPYRLKRDSRGALEEAILRTDPTAPSRAVQNESVAPLRATTPKKLMRALRGDLDTIVIKALKKSPAERYATADAFGEDVARYLRGDVVLAQRDSVPYRALKFTRRHWVAIAGISVLILTLAGGLASTSYEATIAAKQRDAALDAQLRLLTQTAGARFAAGDIPGALSIILEVLPHRGEERSYTPEALNVFQEARAADSQILAITGHADRVRSAEFSPDGRRIVTASNDKTARIWDAETGREIALLSGHTDAVRSAAFSPDGRRIVTASADKTARIWDAATGKEIMLLNGHTDRVSTAVFSPDGRHVVTASRDKTARIWDAATGRQTLLLSGHTERVISAAFSPDGRRIVTASDDKTARLWEAATGREILLISGHTGPVISAAFSPDGRRMVTASWDQTARIWEAATGRQLAVLSGHLEGLLSAAFSPDGERVITASDDETARIWDAATGRGIMLLSGHSETVDTASFSPDGRRIVTASDDKTARLWDAGTGAQILLLGGHTDMVTSAAFSPVAPRIVTSSLDRTARIWDAATGTQILRLSGHTDVVTFAAFSDDGQRVVTASDDHTARIWDAATGQPTMILRGHTDLVETATFSPDGARILTASTDKTARIWDTATGAQLRILRGHTQALNSAAFSPDGARVVTASFDKTARIWDAVTGREIVTLIGHTDKVDGAAFSPDGRTVVTGADDKTARIWDAVTGREIMLLKGHTGQVISAAFSPDGSRVVTASSDRTARIWDTATGQQTSILRGHTDSVNSVAFSSDGRRVVTASFDRTARIWDANAPALDTQIEWAEAAQFDPLPNTERFQLGLSALTDARRWPNSSSCDESAAAAYDPDRRAPGVLLEQIVADVAVGACVNGSHHKAQTIYQHGRALASNRNFAGARQDFEAALAQDYRAAHVELALLLSRPSIGMLDVPRSISLFEQAWNDGVSVAAFELGKLYEHGINRPGDAPHEYVLAPDETRAWLWYRKGADAGEPNALARFAESEADAASHEENVEKKTAHLLESFKYYAAAAERSRREDWPEDAWRNWRYRRASFARLLAREGMMQQVADNYHTVRRQYAPPPSISARLASLIKLDR
jgi:WD40 repeat protein/serine/threonine protein kinase/TPR repeat protein